MLGLRPDSDQHHLHSIRSSGAFRRSSKFADRLSGRFFVSGVSGSFQKHTKQIHELANKDKDAIKPYKYSYQPVLEKHQREELRQDAEKLIELEEKLQELQRVKEAKRQRDRNRRKRKVEFTSAFSIQKAFRNYRFNKLRNATDIITNYLRSIHAKNAICTAVWAIYVLRKFAKRVSNKWFQTRTYRKLIHKVATDNFQLVVDIASLMTAARREVADNMVHQVMTTATQHVTDVLTVQDTKKVKRSRTNRSSNDFLQFFLTEFDRDDDGEDDDSIQSYSDEESKKDLRMTKRKSTTDLLNKPLLKQSSRYLSQDVAVKPKRGKKYDANDHQTQKLMRKHNDSVIQMQEEQKRRLLVVEKLKQRVEEEKILKKFYEDEEKLAKQKQKEDFQKKLEAEIAQRKKLALKLQEERKKVMERKAEEQNREKQELRSMYREDIRLQTLVLRPPKPAQKKKIEIVKKPPEVDQAEIAKQLEKEKALQLYRQKARQRLLERKQEQEQLERDEKMRKLHEKQELQQKKKELLVQAQQQPWKVKRKKSARRSAKPNSANEGGNDGDRVQMDGNDEDDDDDFLNDLLSDIDSDDNPLSDDSLNPSRHSIRSKREEKRNLVDASVGDDIDREDDEHVISSAREHFDNLLDDFAFDDFIEKSLLQIYSAPPTQVSRKTTTNTGNNDGEYFPKAENDENLQAALNNNEKKSNIPHQAKVKKLKIPEHLKDTPYYAAYNRQVKKHTKQGESHVEENEPANHQQRGKPTNAQEKHTVVKSKPKFSHHKQLDHDDEDEEENIPMDENESLLSLLQRAKCKLRESMQEQEEKKMKSNQQLPTHSKKSNLVNENVVTDSHQISPEKKSPTTDLPFDGQQQYPEPLKIPSTDPQSFHHILPSAPTFSHALQNKAPPSLPLPPATLDGIRNRYGLPSDPTAYDNPLMLQKYGVKKTKALPSLKKTASSPAESFAKDNKQPVPEVLNAKLNKTKAKSTDKLESVTKSKKSLVSNKALSKENNGNKPTVDEEERPRSGSKVLSKIHQYQDYEEKLQADYLVLRQQFTEKLNKQLMNSSSNNPLSASVDGRPTETDVHIDANPLRNSITATYATEGAPKISTKDLLMEWAMEDALEGGESTEHEEIEGSLLSQDDSQNENQTHVTFNSQNIMRDLDVVYEDDDENYHQGSQQDNDEYYGIDGEEEEEQEEEEEEEDNGEYDEREYMKNERGQHWKQLLTSNNDDALNAQCLSFLQDLGNKMKK